MINFRHCPPDDRTDPVYFRTVSPSLSEGTGSRWQQELCFRKMQTCSEFIKRKPVNSVTGDTSLKQSFFQFPQQSSGTRHWINVLICLVLLNGCTDQSQHSAPELETERPLDGHARMLEILDEIKEAPIHQRLYFGDRTIEKEEHDLDLLPPSRPDLRFKLLFHVGKRRLWLGDTERSIEHLRNALTLTESQVWKESLNDRKEATFQLALAYLRLGENENCVNCNNGESCLLPIRNAGVHEDQIGSRNAIKYFETYLKQEPDHVVARWLLNIAYMTLGEHPLGVPAPFLIDSHQFESDTEFPRFRNVAPSQGIGTLSLSGGVVVDDFDGDGDLDLMTSSSGFADQMRFFRNVDGSFKDATDEANLTGLYGGLNLIQADYDNDGDIDVFVMRGAWLGEMGQMPNSLLQNDGTGKFQDVTFECGLGHQFFPTQTALWADFNNDGHLDLYVGNENYPSQLFENDGHGQFRDIAARANVQNKRFTKGVTAADFNNDGFPDIYVSNFGGNNRLYRNNRDGTFTDVAESLQVTGPRSSLPAWFWDYNQDGVLDIFVASYSDDMAYVSHKFFQQAPTMEFDCLYEGNGNGGFQEVAASRNLLDLTQSMGANFGDLDNDGYPDFYLGTGYPQYEGLVPNLMYWNREGRVFADVTTAGGFGHLQKGHAIAFADIDNDGDQDLFQQMGGANPGDRAADCLYENPGFGNNWIKIKLVGTKSNRSGIGARIRAEITEGDQSRNVYKWVNSGGSFGASPLRQELGLGKANKIDRLEIYWPTTNQRQSFVDVSVNQVIEITEGSTDFSVQQLTQTTFEKKTIEK
jgi:tetratricopeptide (TPR) repeat protein